MNPHAIVVTWLVHLMMLWAPPEHRSKTYIPEAKETKEQATSRYVDIAQAVVDVAYDTREAPILTMKDEQKARAHSALLMMSIALFESGLRRDVDLGIGKQGRGDAGRSWCLMQIQLGDGKVPDSDPEVAGWTGKDLVADRRKCFRTALRMIRRSFTACQKNDFPHRLAAYASGSCDKGHAESSSRLGFWSRQKKRLIAWPKTETADDSTPNQHASR